ncbi:14027_t:CDS:2, partial [Acaulospora colombiana]
TRQQLRSCNIGHASKIFCTILSSENEVFDGSTSRTFGNGSSRVHNEGYEQNSIRLGQVACKVLSSAETMVTTWFDIILCSRYFSGHDEGWPQLRRVHGIVADIYTPPDCIQQIPPSVQRIDISSFGKQWNHISAPEVQELRILDVKRDWYNIEETEQEQAYAFDHSQWPNLKVLGIWIGGPIGRYKPSTLLGSTNDDRLLALGKRSDTISQPPFDRYEGDTRMGYLIHHARAT